MKKSKHKLALDRLLSPLGDCLTLESARRLLSLKADSKLQAHMQKLATRHTEGRLTAEEESDYGDYVSYVTFVAILKSKARQLLTARSGK